MCSRSSPSIAKKGRVRAAKNNFSYLPLSNKNKLVGASPPPKNS